MAHLPEKVSNLATDQFFESVFGKNHPYGRQVYEPDFEKITPAIVREFHSKHYIPDNMAIIISGKIHPGTVELLNKYFGEINAKKIHAC